MGIDYLSLPTKFALGNDRSWVPDLLSVSPKIRLMCIFPALLLSMLFYLDQNITVRTTESQLVGKADRKLGTKGAYHMDMLVLSGVTAILSVLGLPWVCAATVQSLNHVRALTSEKFRTEKKEVLKVDNEGVEKTVVEQVRTKETKIVETRVTGFAIHALILGSLFLLPILSNIPLPVVSGVFLYLGRKIMGGNLYFDRVGNLALEDKFLPEESVYRKLPKKRVMQYLSIQTVMLGVIWTLKSNAKYSILFPSCIGVLAALRSYVLPKLFSEKELEELDPDL